jgi:transposase-like protein
MPSPNLLPEQKYTFKDFEREFPDERACMEWLVKHFFPHGMHCVKCGEVRRHHLLHTRPKVASCGACGAHTHPTAGTTFHKSSTSLRTWFHAIFLMSATRCGISAMQLMRETGVTYKTAWRMFKEIRSILGENVNDLEGTIEADETFIGGVKRGVQYRAGKGKTMVAGMVERKGRIVAYIANPDDPQALTDEIAKRVMPESMIYTDEAQHYRRLPRLGFKHSRVNHSRKQYVRGSAHTNTIEGYWGNTKRGIDGVYHHVSVKYLQRYLDEYGFRYNHRDERRPMFRAFCSRIERRVFLSRRTAA